MQIKHSDLKVSKVLSDEGDRVVVEIGKTDTATYDVDEGVKFLTLIFVRSDGDGGMEVWDPFAEGTT